MDKEGAHQLLHTLWSGGSKGPEYNKRDWIALQQVITSESPDVALAGSIFERLREIAERQPQYPATAWGAFERALFTIPLHRA